MIFSAIASATKDDIENFVKELYGYKKAGKITDEMYSKYLTELGRVTSNLKAVNKAKKNVEAEDKETWFKQLTSLAASTSILDWDSLSVGVLTGVSKDVDTYCPLAALRNYEDTAAMAQSVLDTAGKKAKNKLGRFSDALMTPIGKIDRFVVERLFGGCQVQVAKESGGKLAIGTEANKVAAGKMLAQVIRDTQQNALATEKSAAMRSNNEIVRAFTPTETGKDLLPKTYPSTKGLNGVGCLGACINFLDDPVFVSKMGLEAIGQLSVRYERALEHRSSLVDAKLINLDLAKASLEAWNGYLMLLCDGKIFMADSRQRYTNDSSGNMQYEWYYLEDIAVYEGQETEYIFSSSLGDLAGKQIYFAVCPMCGMDAEPEIPISLQVADKVYNELLREYNDKCGLPVTDSGYWLYDNALMYYYENGSKVYFRANVALSDDMPQCTGGGDHPNAYTVYLCETHGNKTGGKQKKATVLKAVGDNLFFGTENGVLCSFNFDKRDEDGEIAPKYYSFDGRTILCGCATKMDCCDIPHLTKNTVKKSTVIKTKAMARSAAKVKVRTNKKPYNQIARINSARFAFDDMDFSDFTFETMDKSLYSVKEKEKKWVEKQYYIYSDEYCKPFSLYYISYRYTVAGRYKE